MTREDARSRLALALDVPLPDAQALYEKVAAHVGWVKVGLSLFVEHGPGAVRAFTERGAKVFLDLKLHDIPNTVLLAATRAGALGVGVLTVHAQGGAAMMAAAVEGAKDGAQKAGVPAPRVLAVTVLTSLTAEDLWRIGYQDGAAQVAGQMGRYAAEAGVDGLVCSPREVKAIRQAAPRPLFLCTPGIRPQGAAAGDQARAETPSFAAKEGADLLVVGRPIYGAGDPEAAARAICDEVAAA
jgi:orotidine-5'-phosphate decarboxylase